MNRSKIHSLVQINLHHSKAASANLCQVLFGKGHTGICLIQEPYAYKGRIRGVNEVGNLFVNTNSGENPRACIITLKMLKLRSCSSFVGEILCQLPRNGGME